MNHPPPLQGKRILVTSSGHTAERFAAMLHEAGAQAILMPVIEIADPDSWQNLDEAIQHLYSYHWLFFASGNAVQSFCKRWQHAYGTRTPGEIFGPEKPMPRIAAIGKITAGAAIQYGLPVHYCPDNYLAEDFVDQFPGYPQLDGERILWPRTDVGRDLIIDKLQNAGAQINVVPAYKTMLPANTTELCWLLNQVIGEKQLDAITLASEQTAMNLSKIISLILEQNRQHKLLSAADYKAGLKPDLATVSDEERQQISLFLEDILIVTIGPQTAVGALNYLGKESQQASLHTGEGMVAALIKYYRKQTWGEFGPGN